MQKNVKINKKCNYLVLKIYSLNKNSINSIFKKIVFINYSFKSHLYVLIKVKNCQFFYEKNKIINYLKKENIYFNILGVKNSYNYLNYEFFIKNFVYKKQLDLKFLLFNIYLLLLNYYIYFIKLYFIFCSQLISNFNFFILNAYNKTSSF